VSTRRTFAFFGSSLVSSYWNGAATYYRGLIRALDERGHRITFYEPDAYGRQEHRDIADPTWARVVVYPATESAAAEALESAREADVVVKTSGVGVLDTFLEASVLDLRREGALVGFLDVDAPATLERVEGAPDDPFRAHIPCYDFVLTYGGGGTVVRAYTALGARVCAPIYNALDPSTHHPVPREPRYECDVAFLGNRLPDRERRVEEFLFRCARQMPWRRFLLGGSGWDSKPLPSNITWIGHVPTADHNAFNVTPLSVLNVSRDSMARFGFSPATRVFEAAGAGACLVTDAWEGIELFLEPGREVLVASSGDHVADYLRALTPESARGIGQAARRRVLAEHTYSRRALEVEAVLDGRASGAPEPRAAASPAAPAVSP
jgi:spore maturation protein CgeB